MSISTPTYIHQNKTTNKKPQYTAIDNREESERKSIFIMKNDDVKLNFYCNQQNEYKMLKDNMISTN